MLTYKGYQLEAVRKFAKEGQIKSPTIIHHSEGYTLLFNLIKETCILKNCVLITVKGARPRVFKKARTYTRTLIANGITEWQVKQQKELFHVQ